MGGPGGGSEVLVAGGHGAEKPGRARPLHSLRGWIERTAASHRNGISQGPGAVMHRAPGEELSALRLLEGAQSRGGGTEADLSRCDRRGRLGSTGGVRGKMGRPLSQHQPDLEAELGPGAAVFCVPGGNPEGDIHHQCGGVAEYELAQGDQDARFLSERGGGDQALIFGAGEGSEKMDATAAGLEGGSESLRDCLRGSRATKHAGRIAPEVKPDLETRAWGRGGCFRSPCPPLRPKRSAYGLAGRSSGQGDRKPMPEGGIERNEPKEIGSRSRKAGHPALRAKRSHKILDKTFTVGPPFPAPSILGDRSRSSRVRYAAPNYGAPWTTASGSQQKSLPRGKGGLWDIDSQSCPATPRFVSDPPAVPRLRWTARRSFSSRCALGTVSRPAGSLKFNLRGRRYAVPANGCLVTLMRWPNLQRIQLGKSLQTVDPATVASPEILPISPRRCVFSLDKSLSWMSIIAGF